MSDAMVDLTIRRLSLVGFTPVDGRRVEAGFRDELERLARDETLDRSIVANRLETRQVRERAPERIGADAARALFEAIAR